MFRQESRDSAKLEIVLTKLFAAVR